MGNKQVSDYQRGDSNRATTICETDTPIVEVTITKGTTMEGVVDLCDSSGEETSGPVAEPRLHRNNSLIVIDDSSDEETTPQKQDVIEIYSSSDEETSQVKASVAPIPSPGADFDSSDDEQDLLLSRQRMALRRSSDKVLSQSMSGSEKLLATKPAAVPPAVLGEKSEERSNGCARATSYGRQPHSAIREHPHDGSHTRIAQHANVGRATPQSPKGNDVSAWKLSSPGSGDGRKQSLGHPVSRDVGRHVVERGTDPERHPDGRANESLKRNDAHSTDQSTFKLAPRTQSHHDRSSKSQPMVQPNSVTSICPVTSVAESLWDNSDDDSIMHYSPVLGHRNATGKSPLNVGAKVVHDQGQSFGTRPPFSAQFPRHIQQKHPVSLSFDGDRKSDSEMSPQKQTSSLNDAKCEVLHLSPVDSRVKRRRVPSALRPSKTYARMSTNGDKQQVLASFAGKTAKCLVMKKSERKPPLPSDSDLVPLGRKGNAASYQQYRIRKFATAQSSYSENNRHHESHYKRALKRPKFSNRKTELGPQSSGRGLDDVAAWSRKTPPPVPETHQIDLTVSPTAFDEHITNDKNNVDSVPGLPLLSRHSSAESETPSPNRAISSQSKDWSSADLSCGRDAQPGKCGDENSKCHSPTTDTQAGGSSPKSVDSAASYEMAEEAHASPASLRGDFSKRVSSSAESDASDSVASSDYNSDDKSGELVAEESESSIADFDCQLDAMDIQPRKRSTSKEINYEESGCLEITESREYLPPTPRKQDSAKISEPRSVEEEAAVARRSMRKKKPVQVYVPPVQDSSGEEEDAEEACFAQIDHLSRYKYDKLGRPTYHLSVMGPCDTIYDLKIVVRESGIPGAGLGAFLTYLGARVLREDVQNVENVSRELLVVNNGGLTMPLMATSRDGFGISVTLNGAMLVGKRCSSILGDHAHFDGRCPKLIGGHGVYNESDFVLVPEIELFSENCFIDIGRYGPAKKADRLPQHVADIKNFIFSDEVETYGYGVDELIHGSKKQYIDITDNATGLPHEESRRLIPSYINEIGHDSRLKRNVHIRDKENGSIHYYLDLKNPLKRGDTVELFVDYDQAYEDVRERKGYGIANIENGERSNSHEPTALLRYFDRREFVTEEIDNFSPLDIFYTLEFIVENIQEPIDAVIGEYIKKGQQIIQDKPTIFQLRARRRLHWLSDVFLARISNLLDMFPEDMPRDYAPYNSLLKHSRRWAENMKWHSFAKDTQSLENVDDEAYNTLIAASREDVLYSLSKKIVMPLNEAMWCPAAVDLIKRLSKYTVFVLSLGGDDMFNRLMQTYLKCAKKTTLDILQACKDHDVGSCALDLLVFVSDIKKGERIDVNMLRSFEGFKESGFFRKHTTFPKGITASLLDIQAYRDTMDVCCLPEQFDMAIVPDSESKTHEVLIAKGIRSGNGVLGEVDECVVGYPRHTDFFAKGGCINETWYLLWQVVFVVHCFAEEFVRGNGGHYSLQALCKVVGVDLADAEAVVEQGIEKREYAVKFSSKSGKVHPKKPRSTNKGPTTRTARKGVLKFNRRLFDEIIWKTLVEEFGWTLDVGNRPTDFYFLPPGVKRGQGFKSRKDFFDSVLQVMDHLKTDSKWKNEPKIMEALALVKSLSELKEKLKLKGNFDLDWLIGKLEQTNLA